MNSLNFFDSIFNPENYVPSYRTTSVSPRVNILRTKKAYVLTMDLPGLTEKDINITLKNELLTIKSAKKDEKEEEKAEDMDNELLLCERIEGMEFERSFNMPKDIDDSKVSATFKNGVLSVEIARKEEEAEKRIEIKIA
ncbi:MAG: Hsp20/alpha crystallin family protein [Treponema sp.]|nr:Hsp20/alpha crystallin family protein [Treponema sp.]